MSSNCSKYESLIQMKLDGNLSSNDEVKLQAHLDQCSACSELVLEFSNLIRTIREDAIEDPGPEFWNYYDQSMRAKLHELEENKRSKWGLWHWATGLIFSVIICVAAIQYLPFTINSLPVTNDQIVLGLDEVFGPGPEEPENGFSQQIALITENVKLDESLINWFEVEDEGTNVI